MVGQGDAAHRPYALNHGKICVKDPNPRSN
jgi:hypothetical protein